MTYFTHHLTSEELKQKVNSLYNIYIKQLKGTMHKHTVDEIGYILKNKYLANEIIDDNYLGLDKDPMVNVKNIIKIYRIDNPEIMESLYTEEEKKEHEEIEKFDNANNFIKCCNVILESVDGKYVSGYTMQGMSIRLTALMFVIAADVKEENCNINNNWFKDYLLALEWAGYIVEDTK